MNKVTVYWYGPNRPSSKECLARSAAMFAGESVQGAQDRWQIRRQEKGKPYFPSAPHVHCSVTHSGEYWLGGFAGQPLGLDLQIHKEVRRQALSRRFFHRLEDEYLQSVEYRDFYRVWTAKESFVKLSGEGIDGHFSRFSVADAHGLLPYAEGRKLFFVPFREGYTLCVCAKEISSVTLFPGK